MQALEIFLAVAGCSLALWMFMRSQKIAERAEQQRLALEAELAKSRSDKKKVDAKAENATNEVSRLEKELAEAVARRDEKAMAATLWELELERSYRQWRDVIVPADGARISDVNAGQQLAFAVAQEVDRLREEVGVAIRFDGGLDLPLEPESALGALRIAEEILALACKQSDEVVVSLDQGDEPSIALALECNGWDDPDQAGSSRLEGELENMATRLDGSLQWSLDEDDDARVYIDLTLPAPAPV